MKCEVQNTNFQRMNNDYMNKLLTPNFRVHKLKPAAVKVMQLQDPGSLHKQKYFNLSVVIKTHILI